MKKLHMLLFVAILLTACQPAATPQPTIPSTEPPPSHPDLAIAWQEALNNGNIDTALSYLANDATVTIIPPAEGDGVYNGHAEIRGWYETIVSAKGSGTINDCKIEGEVFTCHDTYADEGLKSLGVDFIEGTWEAVIRDGKIQSYTFTITPESLAKFPPPPPTPVETLADSINDLLGVWWFPKAGAKVELRADGTYRTFAGSETIDEGTYTFDAGKVTWVTSTLYCVDNPTAAYEVYVTKQESKPVSIRMQVDGSDLCRGRRDTLAGEGKFQSPIPESTQELVITQLAGIYKTSVGPNAYGVEPVQYLLELSEDGRWFVRDLDRFIQVQGYYTYTADQIVLKTTGGPSANPACVSIENTYGWSAEGDQLTFTTINVDAKCEGEKFFFTQKPLTLQP